MKKINIAELLKDCPKGMELDCLMYDNLYFDCIREHPIYPIICWTVDSKGNRHDVSFNWYGKSSSIDCAKCVIFPKGKTTWDGFVPPCKFKDGDILTYMYCNKPTIYIYRENGSCNTSYYAGYSFENKYFYKCKTGGLSGDRTDLRLATEEEKQKLFDAIKANGYKWDAETKTLEKLVEPCFKVGDRIKDVRNNSKGIILKINNDSYECRFDFGNFLVDFKELDNFELVPKKFDTLVPFESRVLVRHHKDNKWCGSFFSFIDRDHHSYCYKFVTTAGKSYPMMIPYNGNEWLLGKTDDCDEYYKNW